MKFNFANVNTSPKPIPAESTTTYVAPHDFVGEGRISRFRISAGAFPLMFIPPSSRGYSAAEKEALDAAGLTPTDIIYGFYIPFSDNSYEDFQHGDPTSAYIAPTNGAGNWYKRQNKDESSSGTITIPQHGYGGGVDFPLLSSYQATLVGHAGGNDNSLDGTITSTQIAYGAHSTKNLYWHADPYTVNIQLGQNLGTTMISKVGSILNTTTTPNTPLDPYGTGTINNMKQVASYLYIVNYYIHERPSWRTTDNNTFYLTTKGKYIYSWNLEEEIGQPLVYKAYIPQEQATSDPHVFSTLQLIYLSENPTLDIHPISDSQLQFNLHCPVTLIEEHELIGTPVLFLSTSFNDLLTVPSKHILPIPTTDITIFPDYKNNRTIDVTFPQCVSELINPPPDTFYYRNALDFSSTFTLDIHSANLLPVTSLILTSPNLDFKGETISVDTKALQGVVSPSSIPILRSFYIGVTDSTTRSDFVFTDDLQTTYAVLINNPRIAFVKFMVFALTKFNDLIQIYLPTGNDLAIQLTIV